MRYYRRVAHMIATEGFGETCRRATLRLVRPAAPAPEPEPRAPERHPDDIIAEYEAAKHAFAEKTRDSNFSNLGRFLWYHTVDLGQGVVTPGLYDYRNQVGEFGFPEDMTGMQVLDVGSATGFFAFEFARRGATVTSLELPSIAEWDMLAGSERQKTLNQLMEMHQAASIEELQYLHLDGPFLFCQQMLNTQVQRWYSTIYDVATSDRQFDLIFVSDVLLHLLSPLKALGSLALLCRGKLIIAQTIPEINESQPLMLYLGGGSSDGDSRTWWFPNRLCFTQMLQRVGFRTIDFVREFDILYRPTGLPCPRTVIHATK